MGWYIHCLKNYTNFSGRARRKEYWNFILYSNLIVINFILFGLLVESMGWPEVFLSLTLGAVILYYLAVLVPGLAVTVRRLHDSGKSGWFFFFLFIPAVGGFVFLAFMLLDSSPGENEYGSNPKTE